MNRFSLKHLSDEVLRRELATKAKNEKEATAQLIAHIAEFDERKLYLPAAYESMFAYCVGELGLSEEAAAKRIFVARAARRCPEVFEALAEGRVHLSGLVLLARHINAETAGELLAAAAHKTKAEIEQLIAERFPRPDVAASVDAIPAAPPAPATAEHSPGNVVNAELQPLAGASRAHDRGRVAPLSAEAYAVQFTRSREADERFRYAQELLGHQVNSADIAEVYDRAMKVLIEKLERVRFGACAKPRKGGRRARPGTRHISNEVKRAVWKRDNGQCTYRSESGRRCEARRHLEFDHEREFARGGEATVSNIRLRCPGHNQHAAERTYGAGFMKQMREEAAKTRAVAKAARARFRAGKDVEAERLRLQPHQLEVIPWLRQLGCCEAESRLAVERCRDMADARLEDRVKRALGWFGARIGRKVTPMAAAGSEASLLSVGTT